MRVISERDRSERWLDDWGFSIASSHDCDAC